MLSQPIFGDQHDQDRERHKRHVGEAVGEGVVAEGAGDAERRTDGRTEPERRHEQSPTVGAAFPKGEEKNAGRERQRDEAEGRVKRNAAPYRTIPELEPDRHDRVVEEDAERNQRVQEPPGERRVEESASRLAVPMRLRVGRKECRRGGEEQERDVLEK